MGSPPRVRERLLLLALPIMVLRITPACAGKTKMDKEKRLFSRDHPRVCGKDLPKVFGVIRIPGSPPRVRERPQPGI